jgi:hypothetical protein
MRKPVAVPVAEATAEETTRRKPEVVAVVRRTPWKNRGLDGVRHGGVGRGDGEREGMKAYTLKMVAVERKAAR